MGKTTLFTVYLKNSIILLLLSIAIASGAAYLFAERILEQTVKQSLQYQASFRVERIRSQLFEQKETMKRLSERYGLQHFIERANRLYQGSDRNPTSLKLINRQFAKDNEGLFESQGIDDTFLFNSSGDLLFSMRPLYDEIGERMTSDGFYGETVLSKLLEQVIQQQGFAVSDFGHSVLMGQATVLMAVPIYSTSIGLEEEITGILVQPFSIDWLRRLLESHNGLGESGEVMIGQRRADGSVSFINRIRNALDRQPDQACMRLRMDDADRFPMVRALNREEGAGWKLDYSCQEVYAIWSWIPELRWGILVKQDRRELMMAIDQLEKSLFIGVIPLTLLMLWVARQQSKRLSGPIERLIAAIRQDRLDQYPVEHIEEVNLLADTLKQTISNLNQANRAKDDFLATMSHELRTPLASIIGYCDLLVEDITDPEQRKQLRTIQLAGENQLALVNDILDMSKIQAGKFVTNEIPYSLPTLLQDIHSMMSNRATAFGLQFEVEQKNREPMQLLGDSQRICQILINLVGNAIKFTPEGKIVLGTEVVDGMLRFSVTDNGIGIRPENMKKLFGRFEQEDGSVSRRFGGTGLGLFISRNLAELMGGSLTAHSEIGLGSTFLLSLPYRPTRFKDLESTAKVEEQQSGDSELLTGTVLVAEDTLAMQILIKRILERFGLTVTVVDNGLQAVEQATKEQFDLIVMDMQMPVMDGVTATRQLKQAGNPAPIIALSANVALTHRKSFEDAGVDSFVEKPIDREVLRTTLNYYLKSSRMSRKFEAASMATQGAVETSTT